MNTSTDKQNGRVTAVISHYIRPNREAGYEEWLKGISQAARQFEGQAIITGLVVLLLAYIVMPRLTRLFHGWLHSSS